jgi:L-asparaginase
MAVVPSERLAIHPGLYFHPERLAVPSAEKRVVILGTGGTIAGTAGRAQDHTGYLAGALTAADLLASVPALAGQALETESVAQLDSCDMDHATWLQLVAAVRRHLARADVAGVVITHGTDTLEETAAFIHFTVDAQKPVVFTAAMRPATAPSPDGPQNLVDACTVARAPGARGVLAVLGGQVHAGLGLRKVHGYRVDAFSSGDAGALAHVEDGRLRIYRDWPTGGGTHAAALCTNCAAWPAVDIVTSHAGARAASLQAVVAAGARGIVLAGTGNGSVHHELLSAARSAASQGVVVRRASRCQLGGVVGDVLGESASSLPSAGPLTAPQARVHLLLDLVVAA